MSRNFYWTVVDALLSFLLPFGSLGPLAGDIVDYVVDARRPVHNSGDHA